MNPQLNKLKIAIIYDRANKFGGAERVLLTLHEMFPDAPLYTALYDSKKASWASQFPKIYTSFLQNIPVLRNHHELLGWLMPIAFEQFFFGEYDLVISVTSEAAKGIITGTKTLHVCYCLTPTRYLWSGYDTYFKGLIFKVLTKPVTNYLKWWDKTASQRPDVLISISSEVKNRIEHYYNRKSIVIYPPIDIKNFQFPISNFQSIFKSKIINYYLYVGRLVKYKKVDLLIDAFNELNMTLVIVGTGAEEFNLKHKAKSNIKFLGQVSDDQLVKLYSNAKAFLMPQDEDFGITAVEAQSFGVPVIAYQGGGALDTVINEVTGVFFKEQTIESIKQVIAKFDTMSFNRENIIKNAKRFGKDRFERELQRSLVRAIGSWRWRY